MRVALVLRSGGEYRPEHVGRLVEQISAHLTGAQIVCLSDVDVPCERIPLKHGWPGWWSKQELYRPDIKGDLLFMDLDSVIVGSLADMASVDCFTIMRDVYRPKGLQSSVMFLPEAMRARTWREWIRHPLKWMSRYRRGGDQAFLEHLWLGKCAMWQDILPGQVVSWKVDCRQGIPDGARFIAFHGKPRPWDVGW